MTGDAALDAELIDGVQLFLGIVLPFLPLLLVPVLISVTWRVFRSMADYTPAVGSSDYRSDSTRSVVIPPSGAELNQTSPGVSLNKSTWTVSEFDHRIDPDRAQGGEK